MDRLSAPQQNAIGAYFANLLRKVEQDSGPEFLPRGLDVMGLVRQLALPSSETVEKLSYGDPLFRMPTQSNIPITTDRGYVAEVLGMAPAVPAASRATTRISNEMADQLVRAITGNPQATAPAALEAAGQMAPLAKVLGQDTEINFFNKFKKFPSEYTEVVPQDAIVKASQLVPTQKKVSKSAVELYKSGRGSMGDLPADVVFDKETNQYLIVDGHHRIAAMLESGADNIPVQIIGEK